ncbi:MAG: HAD-IC family P-type ATPase [Clostridiales bacterium]|nr:HAD-IC family P-type ATPase [Clostridiales bacterium]
MEEKQEMAEMTEKYNNNSVLRDKTITENDKRRNPGKHKSHKEELQRTELPVIEAGYAEGLTSAQAEERSAAGWSNVQVDSPVKTVGRILLDNIFTYFNIIYIIIAACLIAVGSYVHLNFLLVIFCNTVIGIYQELKAKLVLDKLNLIAAPKTAVIRDGIEMEVNDEELVRDDIITLATGAQASADGVVIHGEGSFDESFLTGESEDVVKRPGDRILSGSYAVTGKTWVRLDKVGADSFVSKLTLNAKNMRKKQPRGMMKSLTTLVKVIGIVLIPVGAAMIIKELYFIDPVSELTVAVENTAAALLGMIPEGLYLLTSVALAVAVMRLAKKNTLAHDLSCIETLARVDMLCVDKTGTITENTMKLTEIVPIKHRDGAECSIAAAETILSDFAANMSDDSLTMTALKQQLGVSEPRTAQKVVGFKSANKYSAASFGKNENYILGAPEIVLRDDFVTYRPQISVYTDEGYRVLLLALYGGELDGEALTKTALPLALVIFENSVRPEAEKTFTYFKDQGVGIKVISGDSALTAANAARAAGIEGTEKNCDCSLIKSDEELAKAATEFTVFGRTSPEQKRTIISALKAAGHTVAMTGDGVNDVLAMKEADCAVAMASGAEIASQVSHLVLLDSNFASMPAAVAEGRRVINNIERSASLFLVKNIFSIVMALLSIFFTFQYPFTPAQLSLVSIFTIGLPSFTLALQPNTSLVKGDFLRNVIYRALPAAITNIVVITGCILFRAAFDIDAAQIGTVCTILMGFVGFNMLFEVCRPFNLLRVIVFVVSAVGFVLAAIFLPKLFALTSIGFGPALILAVFALMTITMVGQMKYILDHISQWSKNFVRKIRKIRIFNYE